MQPESAKSSASSARVPKCPLSVQVPEYRPRALLVLKGTLSCKGTLSWN